MAAGGRARGAGTRRAATRRAFGAAGAGTGCAVAVGIAGTGHGGFYAEGFSGVARGVVRELREELARLINISELSVRSRPADPEFSGWAFRAFLVVIEAK